MLRREPLAHRAADRVQLVRADDPLVSGDLKDGVLTRVDDQRAALKLLGTEVVDRVDAVVRLIADDGTVRSVDDDIDHLGREAGRVGRGRLALDATHQLPVAGGGVLPGPERVQSAVQDRIRGRWDPLERGGSTPTRAAPASEGAVRRPPAPGARTCSPRRRRSRRSPEAVQRRMRRARRRMPASRPARPKRWESRSHGRILAAGSARDPIPSAGRSTSPRRPSSRLARPAGRRPRPGTRSCLTAGRSRCLRRPGFRTRGSAACSGRLGTCARRRSPRDER